MYDIRCTMYDWANDQLGNEKPDTRNDCRLAIADLWRGHWGLRWEYLDNAVVIMVEWSLAGDGFYQVLEAVFPF
jgi:hypothetical protein